jgi:hypothetical protein
MKAQKKRRGRTPGLADSQKVNLGEAPKARRDGIPNGGAAATAAGVLTPLHDRPLDERQFQLKMELKRRRRDERQRHPPDKRNFRIAQLNRLLDYRYNDGVIPDTGEARGHFEAYLNHLALRPRGDPEKYLHQEIGRWAPWMFPGDRDELVERILEKPERYGAVRLGKLLGLTDRERMHLKITTIRSIDAPSPKKRKLTRDREQQRKKRRAAGATPRAEYEQNSKTKLEPWKADGISKATFYRRRACNSAVRQVRMQHGGETSPSSAYSLPASD